MDKRLKTEVTSITAVMVNGLVIGFAWVVYMMVTNENVFHADRLMLVLIGVVGLFPPLMHLYFCFVYSRKSYQAKLKKARQRRPGPWPGRISMLISVVVVLAIAAYTYSQRGATPAVVIAAAIAANQWYARLVGSKR